jgi:hypothetical protein
MLALIKLVFAAVMLLPLTCSGQKEKKTAPDSSGKAPLFELSFGQNLLFLSESRQNSIQKNRSLVVPTSAVLFFSEIRPERWWKVPVFFNLPTESKQFIQPDGSLKYERASPSIGTGLVFRTFRFDLRENLHLEMEAGPLLSFITDFKEEFLAAPLLAGRFRIRSGENLVMYLGGSFTPGLNAFGLFFGTGTNF